jgi:fluoroacetyl-CoA thioesterase
MRHEVTDADTAAAVGSGDVPVLATPRLIAWMEAATVQSVARFLGTGQTTVGSVALPRVRVSRRHRSLTNKVAGPSHTLAVDHRMTR